MSDENIRELERQVKENPDDKALRFAFRRACLNSGSPELAGFEPGDLVSVTEAESPWIKGSWNGQLVKRFEKGDCYVRPVKVEHDFRVKPSPEYQNHGLYITDKDHVELLAPATEEEQAAALKLQSEIKS